MRTPSVVNVMIQGTVRFDFIRIGEHLRGMIRRALLSAWNRRREQNQAGEDCVARFDGDLFASVIDDNICVWHAG